MLVDRHSHLVEVINALIKGNDACDERAASREQNQADFDEYVRIVLDDFATPVPTDAGFMQRLIDAEDESDQWDTICAAQLRNYEDAIVVVISRQYLFRNLSTTRFSMRDTPRIIESCTLLQRVSSHDERSRRRYNTMIEKRDAVKDEATRLIDSGYRCTSNRYRAVARIDRPDWREFLANDHVKGFPGDKQKNLEQGARWVNALGSGAADFYRRVHSRDRIEGLAQPIYDRVKKAGMGSGWGGVDEFRELIPRT